MDSSTLTARQHCESRFLSLPAEIILSVIARLAEDRKSLCSLSRTCSSLKPFAEEHLYSKIELLSTDGLREIIYAFNQDPKRVGAVKTLKILYKHHDRLSTTVDERRKFNGYVKEMRLLRDWHIESPYDNFQWKDGGSEWVEEDMELFRTSLEAASFHPERPLQGDVGLAKLEKLIIHSHGTDADFWDLGGFHCLFRHPSLRYLHVSCVNLPLDLPQLASCVSQTPLTTLVFDECELEPQSLHQILATPKSLKHLTLGENVHNVKRTRGILPRLSNEPEAALAALMPVAHSLETLHHIDPKHATLPDPKNPPPVRLHGSGMRDFHNLKELECDRCSFLHQGFIMNPVLAPPNLQVLRLFHPRRQDSNFWDELPEHTPYASLPSLKVLEFVEPTALRTSVHLSDYVGDSERTRERHAYAYRLWKHGIDMKMYADVHHKWAYIPPYLHGEKIPFRICLYDSVEVGFHRFINDDIEDEPAISKPIQRSSISSSFDQQINPQASSASTNKDPPETDQLNQLEVAAMRSHISRIMQHHRFEHNVVAPVIQLPGGVFIQVEAGSDDGEWDGLEENIPNFLQDDEYSQYSDPPSDWEPPVLTGTGLDMEMDYDEDSEDSEDSEFEDTVEAVVDIEGFEDAMDALLDDELD